MAIPAKWRIRANVVTFVILAITLLYLMATQVLTILQDRYTVYAIFPEAGGVFTNQEVTYRGVNVGRVSTMELVPQGVKIGLEIASGTRIPAEGTRARVMFRSAVGEQFVDLLPGGPGEPYLEDGDVVPLERNSVPVSTQALLRTLQSVLEGVPPEALAGAINALGEGLGGHGSDIATILESTADLSDLFAARAPEVEGILKNGTEVGGAFLSSRDDFEQAIVLLVVVSQTLEDARADLQRLMRGANFTADELVAFINEYRDAINEALIRFAEVNDMQADNAAALEQMFDFLPTGLEQVVKSFEPDTGLVRFGLVDDHSNPACTYKRNRRKPQDRSPRLPPKNADCVNFDRNGGGGGGGGGGAGGAPRGEGSDATPGLGGLPIPEVTDGRDRRLPARMGDWSWSLFFLNGI